MPHTYGPQADPSHYILGVTQTVDAVGGGTALVYTVPTTEVVFSVTDPVTGQSLPDLVIAIGDTATWTYQCDSPFIDLTQDGGTPVRLHSREAIDAAVSAGGNAIAALQVATAADVKATQALAQGGTGGGPITIAGVQGTTFTLAQIHARDDRQSIPVGEVAGPNLLKTALWTDINQKPPLPILGDDGKIPGQFIPAGLGGSSLTILQNPNGSWPARSTVTSDPTRQVTYVQRYSIATDPPIGTDLATAYATDNANNIPGDRLEIVLPLA